MKKIYFLGLGVMTVLSSISSLSAATLTDAVVCEHCVDIDSARQRAIQLAPGLECYSRGSNVAGFEISLDMECSAPDVRIVIGNPIDLQIYAFFVSYDDAAPWLISATETALTLDEEDAYRTALEFFNALIRMFPMYSSQIPGATLLDESDGLSCPTGTAFDHATQPALEAQLKKRIKSEVARNVDKFRPSNSWWRGLTFGASKRGTNVSFRMPSEGDSREIFRGIEFLDSEIDSGKADVLVFRISNIITNRNNSNVAMDVVLDKSKSTVFGIDLADVFRGALDIDNACVLEKLEQLAEDGIAQFLTLGGGLVDPSNRFGTGGTISTPSSGCFRTVRMKVNDEDQGTIRIPCDRF